MVEVLDSEAVLVMDILIALVALAEVDSVPLLVNDADTEAVALTELAGEGDNVSVALCDGVRDAVSDSVRVGDSVLV